MKTEPHAGQFLLQAAAAGLLALAAILPARADYSNTVMSLHPLGYWQLNETTPVPTDAATNSGTLLSAANGLYAGVTHPVSGALAGSSDTAGGFANGAKVTIPWNAALNPPGPFSVECWANSDAVDGNRHTLVQSWVQGQNLTNSNDRSGWLLRQEGADLVLVLGSLGTPAAGAPYFYYTVPGVVSAGVWQHFLVSYDGTSPSIYINGSLATPTVTRSDGVALSPADIAAIRVTPNPLGPEIIGDRGYGGWAFSGSIDEVAIYGSALGASDALAHYQNGTNASPSQPYDQLVKASSPVGYWRLDEPAFVIVPPVATNLGSWGSGSDGRYLKGASPLEPGVPYHGFGTNNTAARFPGIAGLKDGDPGNPLTPGSCIKIPAQSGTIENMTITCWVKRNGDQVYWRGLVTQRDTDPSGTGHGGNGTGITLGGNGASATQGQGAELRMLWNKDDVYWQYDPQLYTPDQRWAFCAVVFSPTNRTVYLNTHAVSRTVPDNETTMPATPHDWSVNPIFLGYDARGPYYGENSAFNGAMDEVAIFDRALTTNEMRQLYAAAEVPPIILAQPQAPPPPVYEGMMVSLSVVCDEYASSSPLHYQWTKNGVPMPGQTTSVLAFSNLVTNDSGNYTVVVTNAFGAATSSVAVLTVLTGPPLIAHPPQSLQRYAGSTATFTVTAVGSAPLAYQWSFNGTPLSGATSSAYSVFDVRAGDAGNYSVLVTNTYGTTNVNAALTLLTATKLAAVVTERTPLGYWRLDETNGTVAYDYEGGRDGTYGAGVTNNVPGPEPAAFQGFDTGNKAYALNGNGGYVTVPSFGQINGAMTIVAWIKPDAVQSDWAGLVFTRGDGGGTSGLQYTQVGQLGYTWNDAAASYNWQSGLFPTADQWNFVALVVEPTQATVYLDSGTGMQFAVNTLAHGTATWSGVRFGSDSYGGRDYKGSMDDVAVYAYALSADEIDNIRKAGINGIYTPAKAFRWKGTNGADWSVAGNWNNTVPGASDIAVLSDSSTAGATVNLGADVTVGGLRFNDKVANQTIASTSGKTLVLSGGSVEVQAGTLSITCPILATNVGLVTSGTGVLNIRGALQTTYPNPGSWERVTVSGIELSGSGSWTILNDYPVMDVNGTLTVNDGAMIDWSSAVFTIAAFPGDTGILVQNGGVVKTIAQTTVWNGCCQGPGLILGHDNYFGGSGTSTAEYDLNGGTLTTPSVYCVNGIDSFNLQPPAGSAVFRFNGGILLATENDSTDPDIVKEGCTNLMGNLSHAYVGLGGAKIDTAGFTCGMGQGLEHDPALGATADGGLTKLGLGTLSLYKSSTYTGTTKVQVGVLSCPTVNALGGGALEIDASATVNLTYAGTRSITGLTIAGVAKPSGVYGSAASGAANVDAHFTGTGTVTVAPAVPPTPTLPPGNFSIATGGVPTFSNVSTTAGYTYWLTYKDSLKDATWTRIGTGTAGGGNKTFTDTVTPYPAQRFYRLEVQ